MAARHLRLVEATEGHARAYVVALTRFVRPGTPYVVVECAGEDIAQQPSAVTAYTRMEMLDRPELAAALTLWKDGDDQLLLQERMYMDRAREASGGGVAITARDSARAMHPSSMAKSPHLSVIKGEAGA
jgi:hypothetical protein